MAFFKRTFIITLIALIVLSESCFAATPYSSYNYFSSLGDPSPSLNAYLPDKSYVGLDFGTTNLNNPLDMMFDQEGNLYIADTGNNRIVILDKSLKLKKVISSFNNNGKADSFNSPSGIFVTKDNKLFVADTKNARVVVFNEIGELANVFGKPDTKQVVTNLDYKPCKIGVDNAGRIYVVSQGCLEGLIQLDQNGNFTRFFGSNKVAPNFAEIALRKYLSKSQIAQRSLTVPIEYSNLTVDSEGFIYAVTRNVNTDQVKRLNYVGDNIIQHDGWTGNTYGDLLQTDKNNSQFLGVDVDEAGNIYAIDNLTGKIFTYNYSGDLLFTFGGGSGGAVEKKGLFKDPEAIKYRDDKVYVLDSTYNTITVFSLTEFGKNVITASNYQTKGMYDESIAPWKAVLKDDSNYTLAYKGIGNALRMEGHYEDAMKYLKLGLSYNYYSKAFKEYRSEFLRNNFTAFMISIAVFIVACVGIKRLIKKIVSAASRIQREG